MFQCQDAYKHAIDFASNAGCFRVRAGSNFALRPGCSISSTKAQLYDTEKPRAPARVHRDMRQGCRPNDVFSIDSDGDVEYQFVWCLTSSARFVHFADTAHQDCTSS